MAKKVHAVGVVIRNDKGKVLVLRRYKSNPEGNTWGLGGGKVDPGDANVVEAAIREAKEEIGLDINATGLKRFKKYHWDRTDLDIEFDVSTYDAELNDSKIKLKSDESTEFLYKTPNELLKQNDLMKGLYDILRDLDRPNSSQL